LAINAKDPKRLPLKISASIMKAHSQIMIQVFCSLRSYPAPKKYSYVQEWIVLQWSDFHCL